MIPSISVTDALATFPPDKRTRFNKLEEDIKQAAMLDPNKPMTRAQFTVRAMIDMYRMDKTPLKEDLQILASPDFEYLERSIENGAKAAKLQDKGEIL